MGKETLTSVLDDFVNEHLQQIIISNPAAKEKLVKVKIRPLNLRGELAFQAEEFTGQQVFHKNMNRTEVCSYLPKLLAGGFRQAEFRSELGSATVLVGKKGRMTVKSKHIDQPESPAAPVLPEHNRRKRYVLAEGIPVPFLVDLGVMTAEGRVVRSRYDKFRQINRFLEFIEDILPMLDKTGELTVIDFGCGRSYLTFAMYYYLHQLKGYPLRMIGLDLKKDVIERCNQLARRYGFEQLDFYCGDIADYEGVSRVDMVVTLHACDTATDYALEKAVRWGAKVILSAPCCQHELNGQIKNDLLRPVLQYGVIKERMAALYTDAIRAELLVQMGYRTQILEFIDLQHTPKNLLLRAVKEGVPQENGEELRKLLDFLQVQPTLCRLFGFK